MTQAAVAALWRLQRLQEDDEGSLNTDVLEELLPRAATGERGKHVCIDCLALTRKQPCTLAALKGTSLHCSYE